MGGAAAVLRSIHTRSVHSGLCNWARSVEERNLFCEICDAYHNIFQIPPKKWRFLGQERPRRCLGQQGCVSLCDHVQLIWGQITAHIRSWQLKSDSSLADSWRECLDSFQVECHHPDHDTRCTLDIEPTWPQARLRAKSWSYEGSYEIYLSKTWVPHRPLRAALGSETNILAEQMRKHFRQIRSQGPADILYPLSRSGNLPEMNGCGPSSQLSTLVDYGADGQNLDEDGSGSDRSNQDAIEVLQTGWWKSRCFSYRGSSCAHRTLEVDTHELVPKASCLTSHCLIVKYRLT